MCDFSTYAEPAVETTEEPIVTSSILPPTLSISPTQTQPTISQTSTTTKISFMNTTNGQLPADTTISNSNNANTASPGTNISAVVGGAVGGCVIVVLMLAFIVFLVIVLVKRPSKQKHGIQERSGMGFQNAIYDGGIRMYMQLNAYPLN